MPDLPKQVWHVAQDDEVGGWVVVNYNVQFTSQLESRLGHVVVAHVLTQDIAASIVKQHNEELDKQQETSFHQQFDTLDVRVTYEGKVLALRQVVHKSAQLVEYLQLLDHMVSAFKDRMRKEFPDGHATHLPRDPRIW